MLIAETCSWKFAVWWGKRNECIVSFSGGKKEQFPFKNGSDFFWQLYELYVWDGARRLCDRACPTFSLSEWVSLPDLRYFFTYLLPHQAPPGLTHLVDRIMNATGEDESRPDMTGDARYQRSESKSFHYGSRVMTCLCLSASFNEQDKMLHDM